MPQRMPAIFFGHGNPMNALTDNAYTDAWAGIGRTLPHPKAILAVSAHWYIPEVAVTEMQKPPTIHDFGGFPKELFDFEYPAPGDGALAQRVSELLAPQSVRLDAAWGLDHGTWSVLCRVYPDPDVPVIQLSMDCGQSPTLHYELAKKLAPLRDEGVLIIGSGNIVHNLAAYAWGRAAPADGCRGARGCSRKRACGKRVAATPQFAGPLGYPALLGPPGGCGTTLATWRSRSDPGRERVSGALPASGWLRQ